MSLDQLKLDEESIEALNKFIELLRKLNTTGIMDAIIDLLEPNVIGALMKLLMQPGMMRLLDHADKLALLLDKLDYENIDKLAALLNSTIKALERKPKPTGAFGMLFALRNKNAKKGMGVLVELLKALGENY